MFFKGKLGLASSHTDALALGATIVADGEYILKDGEYVHPDLRELVRELRD